MITHNPLSFQAPQPLGRTEPSQPGKESTHELDDVIATWSPSDLGHHHNSRIDQSVPKPANDPLSSPCSDLDAAGLRPISHNAAHDENYIADPGFAPSTRGGAPNSENNSRGGLVCTYNDLYDADDERAEE